MNVWSYWSGPKPGWVERCLNSIARHCKRSTFRLLTPETVDEFVPPAVLHPRWKTFAPGIGTDCLRAALLAHHGGLWIDADTVCLKDPEELITRRHDPAQCLYMTWDRPPFRVNTGYIYSPAKYPVAMRWLEGVNSALRWAVTLGWMEPGEQMITPMIRQAGSTAWMIPRETFMPIDIDSKVGVFYETRDWREFVADTTIAFGLNHSWMMEHRKPDMDFNAEQMAGSGILIHRLLTEAA